MEFLAILFLIVMTALAGIATAIMLLVTGLWGGLGFLAFLAIVVIVGWSAGSGRGAKLTRDTLSGPQQPLATDRDDPPRRG